jgi:hypothetical protein
MAGNSFAAATDGEGNLIAEGLALRIMNLATYSGQRLQYCRMAAYPDSEGSFDLMFQRVA